MRKLLMTLLVLGSMLCIVPQRVAWAEEVERNTNNKWHFTDAATGETSLVSMEETDGENEEVRISYGNMFSTTGILTGENSSVSARAILGNDNRWKVADTTANPYAAIGLVEVTYTNGYVVHGTGFMVSGRTMLTAAHNLVEQDFEVEKIAVYLKKSRYYTTPTAYASSWYICEEYDDYASRNFGNDYAVLRFSSDISKYWFAIDTSKTYDEDAYLCGYPKDKVNATKRTYEQWCASGPLVAYTEDLIEHEIDSIAGQSGSPIFVYSDTLKRWVVKAIYVGDVEITLWGKKSYICYGRRITSELFDWLLERGYISK